MTLVGFKGHDALLGPADPVGHPDVVRRYKLDVLCCLRCRRGRGAAWARRPLLLVGRKIPGRIGSGHRGWYHSVDLAEDSLPSRKMSERVPFRAGSTAARTIATDEVDGKLLSPGTA